MLDKIWVILISLFIILILLIIFGIKRVDKTSSVKEAPFEDPAQDACYICRQAVSKNLKASSTAKFQLCNEATKSMDKTNIFTIHSYVDSQNSFGAQIRTEYKCTVEKISDKNWILLDLKFED